MELLDKYFGSVCELDIIFNFEKAYYVLDEYVLGGHLEDTNKKNVLKAVTAQDLLQEVRVCTYKTVHVLYFVAVCDTRR